MLKKLRRRIRSRQARRLNAQSAARKLRFEAMESRFLLSAEVIAIPPPDPSQDIDYQHELEQQQINQTLGEEGQQQVQIPEQDSATDSGTDSSTPLHADSDATNEPATQNTIDDTTTGDAADGTATQAGADESSDLETAPDDTDADDIVAADKTAESTTAAPSQTDTDQITQTTALSQDAGASVMPVSLQVHQPHEIIFIDASVEDYRQLLDDLLDARRQTTPVTADSPVIDGGEGKTGATESGATAGTGEDIDSLLSFATETATPPPPPEMSPVNDSFTDENTLIVLLDAARDGIDQINEVLQAYQGVAAVHILSHGSNGNLRLGNTGLNNAKLKQYSEQLKSWGRSLSPDGDILLYGCNIANGSAGVQFVQNLAELTKADIAASSDATGSEALGGDWQLEVSTGDIESGIPFSSQFINDYAYLLNDYDGNAATLTPANNTPGDDHYFFSDNWGADEVDGGANATNGDTLDFANHSSLGAVTQALTFSFSSLTDVAVTDGTNTVAAVNIENIISGDGNDTLDFSAVSTDLVFAFDASGDITIGDGLDQITVSGIESIIAGSGTNTFSFGNGSVFTGTISGGSGTNDFDFADGSTFSGVITGGPATNNYLFHTGAVFNGVINGDGVTDTLDFTASSDILTFSGNATAGYTITSDNSNLQITHTGIENINGVDLTQVNITEDQQQALMNGLSKLTEWGAEIQALDQIGYALSGLGANVGVNLGNSLDIAESLDQLRLDVKQHTDGIAPVLAQDIQDLLNSFSQQNITYADRAIVGDVFDPAVTGNFAFNIDVNLGDRIVSSTIDVTGAATLSGFVDNINAAITGDSSLSGKIKAVLVINENDKLIASDDKSRVAFQVNSPDATDFTLKQTSGLEIGFSVGIARTITSLKDEIQDLSALNVYSTGGLTAQLDIVNGLPELVFKTDLNADRTTDFHIDLGKNAEDVGLDFDATATVPMKTALSADLDLILKLGDGSGATGSDFLFNLNSMTLDGKVDAAAIDSAANIGFLAATAKGTFDLEVAVSTTVLNRVDPADKPKPNVNVDINNIDLTNLTFNIDQGNVEGLDTFNEPANELTIDEVGKPLDGRDIDLALNNFDNLGLFKEFNAASFVSQIGTIRDWFGSVSESDIFKQIDIPFVTPTLDAIFDMADTVGDNLLYDDAGDGKDDDATLVVDLREALKDANLDSKLRVEGYENKVTGEHKIIFIAIDSTVTDIDVGAVSQLGFTGAEQFDQNKRTLTATGNATPDSGDVTFNIKINNNSGTAVSLSADATSNNTAVGNDTAKLVDENNEATFKTTQQLADKLSDLLTVDNNGVKIKPKYDTTSKLLTFDLSFTPASYQLDVPVDFNFDLSPIGNIGTSNSPDISLGAGIDISLVLGLDLNDKPGSGGEDLLTTTRLVDLDGIDSVDDAIRPEYSVSADQVPAASLSHPELVDITFKDSGAELTGNPKLTFNDNGTGQDTIRRSTGDWEADGFRQGQQITISKTGKNNGTYTIEQLSADTLTLAADSLQQENDISGVKVTGAAATMTESPKLNFSTLLGQGIIYRSAGSWSDDGFESGDDIVIEGAGVNNGVYRIESAIGKNLTLVPGTSFTADTDVENVTITVPDRIILDSGNWSNDEFKAGQILSVSGTQLNNRTFLIAGVSDDGLTLFLSPDAKIRTEHLNNDQATKAAPDLKVSGGPVIRLSEDAVFTLDDGSHAVEVRVFAQPQGENSFVSATSDNKNLFDLVNDINSAIQAAFDDAQLVNKYKAEISNGRILITDISDNSAVFTLTTAVNNTAHTEIGFNTSQDADSDDLLITLSDRSQHRIDLNGAETIQDVINRIQDQSGNQVIAQIDPDSKAGLRLTQAPTLTGNPRLTFDQTGNAIIRSDGHSWSDDHFAAGQLIRVAGASDDNNGYYTVFEIVDDPGGKSYLVLEGGSLVNQTSVKDVRITLSSTTTDGDEIFRVEALNGSRAAAKLGILKADSGTDVNNDGKVDFNDGDGIINGDAIAGASILDRIFIQDPTVTGNLTVGTPDGIEVVGDFGFVSVALNGDGSFDTKLTLGLDDPTPAVDGITINELIKSLDHIGSIVSTPSIGGDKVGGSLQFSGQAIVIGSGNDATWDGFAVDEYISVVGTEHNDGHYKITAVSTNSLTVDVANGFTTEATANASVLNQIGSFGLNVEVKPSFGLINDPDATETRVVLFDFGSPFAETDFKQGQFTPGDTKFVLDGEGDENGKWTDRIKPGADVVAELEATVFTSVDYVSQNSFSVANDQRTMFELGARVTVTLGSTQVTSKIKSLNYDQNSNASTFILEDSVLTGPIASVSIVSKDATTKVSSVSYDAQTGKTTVNVVDTVLSSGVTGLTVDTPQSLDYLFKLPDLGDLIKFDSIGISQIIDGLNQLSEFLGQFEAFGFLSEPIPLINVSVNDVLAFADRFDAAVQEAQNNPAGTLQVLEDKLKEALGIPAGRDSGALQFNQPQVSATGTGILVGEGSVDVTDFTDDAVFMLSLNYGPAQLIRISHVNATTGQQIATIGELKANINRALKDAFGDNKISATFDTADTDSSGILTLGSVAGTPLAIRNPIDFSIYDDGNVQMLRMDFGLGVGFSRGLDVSFDLGGDNGILSGAAGLEASGAIDFNLSLGVDLEIPDDGKPNVYMFDSDSTGQLEAIGNDLAFRAGIGPLGVFINDGYARIGGDIGGDPGEANGSKLFTFGLDFDDDPDTESYKLISDIVLDDDFVARLAGSIKAELPVYFPTESLHKGAVTFNADLSVDNSGYFDSSIELGAVDPDGADIAMGDLFTFDLNELSLMDNLLLAVDGIDAFLGGLQDVLDGEVFGIPLPLIGDKLADGARFIEDLRDDFIDPFRDEIEHMADQNENIVSKLLFDLLGPSGLGLLMDTNNDGIDVADITLDTNVNDGDGNLDNDYMQWNMVLGQTLNLGSGIALDLGIPGLGLETRGDVNVDLGWNLNFGFGISFEEAFYLDISDPSELEVTLDVSLPDFGLSGDLAFLQLDAKGNRLTLNNNGEYEIDENGNITSHFHAELGVDVYNKKDENDERLAFSELGDLGLEAGIAGEAIAALHFELKLDSDLAPGISGVFPKVVTDFFLEWSLDDNPATKSVLDLVPFSKLSSNLVKDGLKLVEFQNVALDLGSFISDFIDPVLGTVRDVTEPLQPIIDFLTAPLPVISDLGPELTILDIAEMTGKVNTGFIESIADLITFINAIPVDAGTILLDFGDFPIFNSDPNAGVNPGLNLTDPGANEDLKKITTPDNGSKEVTPPGTDQTKAGKTKSFKDKITAAGDFDFPIINDPSQIFNLLLGEDAVLMTYDLKPLVAEFSYKQSFPVYPPLYVAILGQIAAKADFAFGFDTSGISQFADSGFRNPLLIFNGFYISDTDIPTGEFGTDVPELTLSGFLGAAAELNLGIASAGVGGGVGLDVYFNLFDPNHDGKVRVPEIVNSIINEFRYGSPALAPMALFDVSGDVYAKLFAYIEFLFFELEFDITPPITLLEFDIPFTRVPTLATDIGDGILQLNMGDFASQRLNYNTTDGDEHFIVSGGSGNSVTVTAIFGSKTFSQTYNGVSKILAMAGEGNDIIDLRQLNSSSIEFDLNGGVGNDQILLGAGAGGHAAIHGGVGDDVITGGSGDDEIYGDAGNDRLSGGSGDDTIFGDEGDIAYRKTPAGNTVVDYIRSRVKVTDGDDVIYGDDDNDSIFGGGGKDTIEGGSNDDLIIGDGGILRSELTIVAAHDVSTFELSDDALLEFQLDGEDYHITVLAGDTTGFTTLDQLIGLINNQLLNDEDIAGRISVVADEAGTSLQFHVSEDVLDFRVKGGVIGDTSIAVSELGLTSYYKKVAILDDINRGDGKADTLSGNDGNDVIYGGRGDDTIAGNADDDKLYGGDGFDLVYGNTGNDRLFGGEDNDDLSGGAGDDHIEGGAGHDRIWGEWMVDEAPAGAAGADSIWGGTGADLVFGGDGDDFLFGDSDQDTLFGEAGNDSLDGGHGADWLFGGEGDDTIKTSAGDDFIDGEAGSDEFFINTMGEDVSSLVTVFDSGTSADTDKLTINGTDLADRFLLRASGVVNNILVVDKSLDDLNAQLADIESRLDDMNITKSLTLSVADKTRSFIAKLNNEDRVERVNYYDNLERIVLNTLADNDQVVSDNTTAEVQINGGDGDDLFQVGQIFNSPRDTDAGIDQYDVFETVQTTKGFLSNGINAPMTINGEDGNDSFVVFRNLKVLTLNGGDGDDDFLVKAFALEGSVDDPDRDLTDITGAGGADLIQYTVNAPVGINGGDGLDTVIVLGTEFGDDFVVTEDGVYGAGLNVSMTGIEVLKLDTAEGNDRIFVLGTGPDNITQIYAGEGSDAFFIAGDTPPVVSNDLLGHSGLITHEATSGDVRFDGINVDGISANVGDDDEPFVRIIKNDGALRVTEDGAVVATYSLVLTREPRGTVRVTAASQTPSPNEVKNGVKYLTINGQESYQLVFSAENWFIPQTLVVMAEQDTASEGTHVATINHLVGEFDANDDPVTDSPTYHEMAIPSVNVEIVDDDQPGLVIQQSDQDTRVIEGAAFGAAAPFADSYTIRLNQQPTSNVTVQLLNEDGQLLVDHSVLSFTPADWNIPQTVQLIANDDAVKEGFHFGYIKHIVSSSQSDVILTATDTFGATSEANKRSSVVLRYLPDEITSVMLDGKLLNADRYSLDDKQLTVLDTNGQPQKVMGEIVVAYRYVKPGFQEVAVETVAVEVGDNDAPGVLVAQSGGSTNVLESGILASGNATGAAAQSIMGDFSAGDYSGLSIVITAGTGAGQARTIVGNTDVAAQVGSAWDIVPDTTSRYDIVSTIAPVTDSYQVVLTAQPTADVAVDITPQPTKTSARPPFLFSANAANVAVSELGFTESSDATISLTSANPAPDNGRLGGDLVFYIDLTPDDGVDNRVQVILTQTAMAGYQSIDDLITGINDALKNAGLEDKIFSVRDENRVVIAKVAEPQRQQVIASAATLTFTRDNWNIPQTVFVTAINDNVVDGGEIKVFAPIEQTLARIQGPLIINGAGGDGSDAGLGADPFRLPGESNDVGNVVAVPTDSNGDPVANEVVLDQSDIDKLGPTYFKSLDTFQSGDENDDSKARIYIRITSGPGEGQQRVIVARNGNTFILATDWDAGDLPDSDSRYIFVRQLGSVNEAEQVDVATVFHIDSLADNIGSLTATRLFGLGMGPDMELDGLTWPGGMTYTGLENLTIHMGNGDDQLNIYGAQNREDFHTVTIVNTGAGDDKVTVDIEADNGLVASGNVSASRSQHLQDDHAGFITAGRGLSGYLLRVTASDGKIQERTILFNDANTLYVDEAWATMPQAGDSYQIIRRAAGQLAINTQDGNDSVDASVSTAPVIVFGGPGDDVLIGGHGDDILIGDRGQIDYLDDENNIVTRFGSDDIPAPRQENPDDPDNPIVIFRQTDGVFRDPAFIMSRDPYLGGNDIIHGGNGNDLLIGGAKSDQLFGEAGNDVLIGDGGKKVPLGGNREYVETIDNFIGGNDVLDGGPGNDIMFGGFGNDLFVGNFDEDVMLGEYGRVTLNNGKLEFILRLGQGSLDLAASTLFSLYGIEPYVAQAVPVPGQAAEALQEAAAAAAEEAQDEARYSTHHTEVLAALPPPGSLPVPAYHVVEKNDTLWDLAATYLGDPMRWPEIWALNPQIKDPDLIFPGMQLKLPASAVKQDDLQQQGRNSEAAEPVLAEAGLHDSDHHDMEQIAVVGLGLLGARSLPLSRNRHTYIPSANPDGAFILNDLNNRLQPYYPGGQTSHGDAVLQIPADVSGPVIEWGASYASSQTRH